jgi:predicted TIM-barrel fold metal-dependent hydrolase
MRKLDAYNHIWPEPYYAALKDVMGPMTDITRRSEAVPMMVDLDVRFRVMDRFDDYQQILSLASPPLELAGDALTARRLAEIGNDSMAELCDRYPERFPGCTATIAMHDLDGAVDEIDRAIGKLGAAGIQLYTNVAGKPLDAPEFRPVFERMHELDKPIWVHPARGASSKDYLTEDKSLYEIWWTFGWPYETAACQARLVWSKIMTDLPNLKFIFHHAGGMVPFTAGRVDAGWSQMGVRTSWADYSQLPKELGRPHSEIFRSFFVDTASFGAVAPLECARQFYSGDRLLFASDAPFDPEKGPMYIRETIRAIETMDLSEEERAKIFHGNLLRITGLR